MDGAPIDDAEKIPDGEAVQHIYDVLIHEGLSVGTSSGINIAAAVRVAKQLGPGHTVVTISGGWRLAVSVEAVQSGVSALEEPAGAELAG